MATSLCTSATVTPLQVDINISTTPTGVEVWYKELNGTWTNTGLVTPGKLIVSANQTVTIQLRKTGYTILQDTIAVGSVAVNKSYTLVTVGKIIIENVVFDKSTVMEGSPITATITVKNTGGTAIADPVLASYSVNGGSLVDISFTSGIPIQPGGTATTARLFNPSGVGNFTICVYPNYE